MPVDEQLRAAGVAGGWLYAIGDCNGLAPPTHMGKYHGRIALRATSVEILGEPVGLDVAHAYQSDGGTPYAVDCTCGCSPGTIRGMSSSTVGFAVADEDQERL